MYRFNIPTELVCGIGCVEHELVISLAELKATKTLLVTDSVMTQIGQTARITALLDNADIEYLVFDGAQPENPIEVVYAAVEQYSSQQIDTIVALGGGSSIDCAKAISLMLAKKLDTLDQHLTTKSGYFCNEPLLPMIAIPTTSGTGSEISGACGVKDVANSKKESVYGGGICPSIALVDAEYHKDMPPSVTLSTGLDAMSHAMEPLFSLTRNPLTNAFAVKAIRMIVEALPKVIKDGSNLAARQQMAEASSIAMYATMQSMTHIGHGISHATGGVWNLPHGIATAHVLFPMVEFLADNAPDSVADLLPVFSVTPDVENPGKALRNAMEEFAFGLGLPMLGEYPKTDLEQLEQVVDLAQSFIAPRAGLLGDKVPNKEWIEEVIKASV